MIKTDTMIDILGSQWLIKLTTHKEDPDLEGYQGLTCPWQTQKTIYVNTMDLNDDACPEAVLKETLRHELVHAVIHESGLSHCTDSLQPWTVNEQTVDWIAMQAPKTL